jgi:hypothetical protein
MSSESPNPSRQAGFSHPRWLLAIGMALGLSLFGGALLANAATGARPGASAAKGGPVKAAAELPETETALECSETAIVLVGETLDCVATVIDIRRGPISSPPSGRVNFSHTGQGTFSESTCLLDFKQREDRQSCKVRYTPTNLDSGQTLFANYVGGDGVHIPSEGSQTIVLFGPLSTTTALACEGSHIAPGASTACVATVTDTSATPIPPSDKVGFSSDGPGQFNPPACSVSPVGGTRSSCEVTFTAATNSFGPRNLTASYVGDFQGQFAHIPSQATTSIDVSEETETTVSCSPEALTLGHSTTCTASVRDTGEGLVLPITGEVTFSRDDQGSFSSPSCVPSTPGPNHTSSCQVTYTPSGIGTGSHQISASFAGDGEHDPSQGATLLRVFTPATLRCNPVMVRIGHPATCAVTVTPTPSQPSPPTGQVRFASSGHGSFSRASCTLEPVGPASDAGCTVRYTPSDIEARFHRIDASYQGDGGHEPNVGSAVLQVIGSHVRYAAPGGTGQDPCTDRANPCTLFKAASSQAAGTTVAAGDEVIVEPGTYSASAGDLGPGGSVFAQQGIGIHGVDGKPRPKITSSRELAPLLVNQRDDVSHLEIEIAGTGSARGIAILGGVVEGVVVRLGGTAPESYACELQAGLLRDSVCLNAAPRGRGVGANTFFEGANAVRLRNVTAIATGQGESFGLSYRVVPVHPNTVVALDARSVIAKGTSADVQALATANIAGDSPKVEVSLDHSDFATVSTHASPGGEATVTQPGAGSNVEDAPMLAADGFHELATSPTVDRGATDSFSGAVDVDGQARILGPAADIGADEMGRDSETHVACFPAALALGRTTTCRATVVDPSFNPIRPSGQVDFESGEEGTFGGGASCALKPLGGKRASCAVKFTPATAGTQKVLGLFRGDALHDASQGTTFIHVGHIRFAAPRGTGADPCADPAHPCSLFTAASVEAPGTSLAAGDEVVMAPGTYSDAAGDLGRAGNVRLAADTSLHGEPGQPRPLISTATKNAAPLLGASGDSIFHLEITSAVAESDIFIAGGVVDDLIARSSAPEAVVCEQAGGLIRDSACLGSGSTAIALGGPVSLPAGTSSTIALRNVTAVASGSESAGLRYEGVSETHGTSLEVDGVGVIAQGVDTDVLAKGVSSNPGSPGTGAHVEVHLDHSDYVTAHTGAGDGGTATVTAAGTEGNITAAPRLGADGIHEQPASPTIDAGDADELSGELDVDGQPRTIGAAPDIGADEFGVPTATRISCQPGTVALSAEAHCTATVEDTAATPSAPTGQVEFATGGEGTFSKVSCELGSGVEGKKASCETTYQPSAPGPHQIVAAYLGDAGHATSEASTTIAAVEHDPTTTSLSCAPDPVEAGHPTHCKATVKDTTASGASMPSGKVAFSTAAPGVFSPVECTLAGSGDTASCSVDYTPAAVGSGVHALTASYPGDGSHEASEGEFEAHVIAQSGGGGDSTATTLQCAPASVILGGAAACTAIVEDTASGGAAPSGEVAFESDGPGSFSSSATCTLFSVQAGQSRCQIVYTPSEVGLSPTHTLEAGYRGDGGHAPSSAEAPVTVLPPNGGHPTATSIDCQPSSVFLGGPGSVSICTATVKDTAAGGATAPSGGVVFASDGPGTFQTGGCVLFAIGQGESRCQVVYRPAEVGPPPSHTVTAIYPGDAGHEPSVNTTQVVVQPPNGGHPTQTAIHCEPASLPARTTSTCTATVEDADASTAPPAGNVVFASDSPGTFAPGGCTLAGGGQGTASCSVDYVPLRAGEHEVTAVYGGNAASASTEAHEPSLATTEVTVAAPVDGTATKALCSPASPLLGVGATTCTATVEDTEASGASHPSGEVRFQSSAKGAFSDGAACNLPATGNGKADSCSVTYTPAAVGAHRIKASYQGEAGHRPSEGTADLAVAAHPTQTTLACAPTAVQVAATANCTVTVADATTAPSSPTGTVKLQSDGPGSFSGGGGCALTGIGGGRASCQISYTPSALGTATHKLAAAYSGDAGHQPSQGAAQVQVGAAPNTLIKKKPRKKTARRKAKFKFVSDQPGSTFQCKLDKKPFKPCRSPLKVKRVKPGRHTFRVRAVNPQGVLDPTPAVFKWKVGRVAKRR